MEVLNNERNRSFLCHLFIQETNKIKWERSECNVMVWCSFELAVGKQKWCRRGDAYFVNLTLRNGKSLRGLLKFSLYRDGNLLVSQIWWCGDGMWFLPCTLAQGGNGFRLFSFRSCTAAEECENYFWRIRPYVFCYALGVCIIMLCILVCNPVHMDKYT